MKEQTAISSSSNAVSCSLPWFVPSAASSLQVSAYWILLRTARNAAGVRSLNFLDHLLSAGSGRGRLFFYDMRASAYLDLDIAAEQPHLGSSVAVDRGCLQCGTGYLNQTDTVYLCVPFTLLL